MTAGIVAPPRHRLDQLLASTSARWHDAAGNRSVLAAILILSVIAGRYSEVDPGNLFRHLSGLISYFGRIPPQTSDEHFAARRIRRRVADKTRIVVFSPDVSETGVQDEIASALLGIGLVAFEIVDRRFDLFTGLFARAHGMNDMTKYRSD